MATGGFASGVVIVAGNYSLILLTRSGELITCGFVTFGVNFGVVNCPSAQVTAVILVLLVDEPLLELADFLGAALVFHPVVVDQFVQAGVRVRLIVSRTVHLMIAMAAEMAVRCETVALFVIFFHSHHAIADRELIASHRCFTPFALS